MKTELIYIFEYFSFATVKYFSPTTNLCIIRVARDHHRIAWAAVTLITKLQGKTYVPNVIHVSGRQTFSLSFYHTFLNVAQAR